MKKVRVRFAPSPTGPFHIGSARTALFNWFFAKSEGGDFILRIEDTDKERSKKEFEEDIKKGLEWLGVKWDKICHQSERVELYKKSLQKLLDEDKAYYCFCSKEELEAERESLSANGLPPKYSGRCAKLPKAEVGERLKKMVPCVIRFKTPLTKVAFKDLVRGKVEFDLSLIGDIVVAKSLDEPLYNFAVVIDDAEMNITHVIRGEDHISNTPKQIVMAHALGFEIPQYAHLPLILGRDRSKLSKRQNEVSLNDYVGKGYLREAVINFLMLLGWHPKEDREMITPEEITKEFDIKRTQKGGAIFNIEKLDWLNAQYLRQLSAGELIKKLEPFVPKEWRLTPAIVETARDRLSKLSEIEELINFFFVLPNYDAELLKWKDASAEETIFNLEKAASVVSDAEDLTKENLEKELLAAANPQNRGALLWPLRVALSGKGASPSPFEIIAGLGKEETLRRIQNAIQKIKL